MRGLCVWLGVFVTAGMAVAGAVSNATLAQRVRGEPRSPEARAAVKELLARGADGRRWLATLVSDVARKDEDAAVELVQQLAPDREMVKRAWRETLPAAVRSALATALAPGYPEDRVLLERALFDSRLPKRRDLLVALGKAGVPDEILRRALGDEELAETAFATLLDRGWTPEPKELELVARGLVHRAGVVDRLCAELKAGRMWTLLEAVAKLTKELPAAHRLLLRVSGKDIARDPLLWKSWIAAQRDRYEIPDAASPGRIAAAILDGVAHLRADLEVDGRCDMRGNHEVGATALALLALRAAGVPADDPVIVRALATTIFDAQGALAPEVTNHLYTCTITIMLFATLDREKYAGKIQKLASAVAASQLENGQWTYRVHDRYASKKRPRPERPFGDNSNTQYALLGLRAARQAGADVPAATWMRAMTFWLTIITDEGWGYGPSHARGVSMSMTAAGVSSIAICLEGLFGKEAAAYLARNAAVRRGCQALGRQLLGWGYRATHLYGFYGVERACVLAGVRRFNDFDWYREGALELLAGQRPDGSFGPGQGGKSWNYGPAIDTSYALLFLRRATTPIAGVPADGVIEIEPERPVRRRPAGDTRVHLQ